MFYLRYGDCAHAIKAVRTQPHPAQQQYIMILLQLVAVVHNVRKREKMTPNRVMYYCYCYYY